MRGGPRTAPHVPPSDLRERAARAKPALPAQNSLPTVALASERETPSRESDELRKYEVDACRGFDAESVGGGRRVGDAHDVASDRAV